MINYYKIKSDMFLMQIKYMFTFIKMTCAFINVKINI